MASRTISYRTDDLDGKELKDGQGQTVSFAVGRIQYEIDLSNKNAGKFFDVLKPYTEAARKISRDGTRAPSKKPARLSRSNRVSRVDNQAVRAWAASNGVEVSPRGRISADVIEQFRAAGN